MNSTREKRVRKTLKFYHLNFGFFAPYNILIDATFCYEALERKVLIKEQLPVYFNSKVNLVTTQCVIQEVENISKAFSKLLGAWLIAKTFKVHKCGHSKKPKAASKCIMSMLGHENTSRYIVATMDQDQMQHIRNNVLVAPILYLHGRTPTIERPLDSHREYISRYNKSTLKYDFETLREIKNRMMPELEPKPRKKKRKRNPNPLSCLESQKIKFHALPNPDSKKNRRKKNKANKDILSQIKEVFAADAQKSDQRGPVIPPVPAGAPDE